MISEEYARELLEPYHEKLAQCVHSAWHRYVEIRPMLATMGYVRTRACLMYDLIHDEVVAAFQGEGDVEVLERSQNFFLRVSGQVILRFNKVDGHLLCRNIPTQLALDYDGQADIPGLAGGANLRIGYLIDETGSHIVEVAMTCPVGRERLAWAYELPTPFVTEVEELPNRSEETEDEHKYGTAKKPASEAREEGK